MKFPHIGEEFPLPSEGAHGSHRAVITAIDVHGEVSFIDETLIAPTVLVECSCGQHWTEDLVELVTLPQRRLSA